MAIDGIAAEPSALRRSYMAPAAFSKGHKWDHDFFLLTVALIWLGILMGFVPEIIGRFHAHKPPFPAVVYFHKVLRVSIAALLN